MESKAQEYFLKITDNVSSSTTVPIKDFSSKNIDDADFFAENFINLLGVADNRLFSYLQYIVRELITNAIDHSNSIDSTICAGEIFPNIKESEIVVVDAGVGFLRTLRKKYPEITRDDDAIEKALQKGVTGSTERSNRYNSYNKNAGYGFYVISRIIKEFGGTLKIISRQGSLTLYQEKMTKNTPYKEDLWFGSIVIVKLKHEKFSDMSFENFLKKLREEDKEKEEKDLF